MIVRPCPHAPQLTSQHQISARARGSFSARPRGLRGAPAASGEIVQAGTQPSGCRALPAGLTPERQPLVRTVAAGWLECTEKKSQHRSAGAPDSGSTAPGGASPIAGRSGAGLLDRVVDASSSRRGHRTNHRGGLPPRPRLAPFAWPRLEPAEADSTGRRAQPGGHRGLGQRTLAGTKKGAQPRPGRPGARPRSWFTDTATGSEFRPPRCSATAGMAAAPASTSISELAPTTRKA